MATIAGMTTPPCSFYAERIDPSRNMARFYALEIMEDLFGVTRLERRWGRIGSCGQKKVEPVQDRPDTLKRMDLLAHQKRKRGYIAK